MSSPEGRLGALRRLEESLFGRLAGEMNEMRLDLNGRFDALEARFERLETEYHVLMAAVRRVEETLAQDGRARLRDRT